LRQTHRSWRALYFCRTGGRDGFHRIDPPKTFGFARMDRAHFRLGAFVCSVLFALCGLAAAAGPTLQDDFEGPQNSWRAGDADTSYRLEAQSRMRGNARNGQSCERVQISAGAGTYVYFSHDVTPSRIVAELCPSVWVKSTRPGVQVLARVVLPHTTDPRSGKPISTLIAGDSYTATSTWQQLRLTDTPKLLNRQLRVLRNQLGGNVDPREAYIDQVLLNVFGGPGQTIVDIDDLELAGAVPFDASQGTDAPAKAATPGNDFAQSNRRLPQNLDPNVRPVAAFTAPTSTGPAVSRIGLSGSVLQIDGHPMFPRIARSQGEPLAWFKEQGFNCVRFGNPLTPELLAEAKRLGIRLVGPPPIVGADANGSPTVGEINADYDSVLAWHLGDRLANKELAATAALAKQLRRADQQLKRPIVCSADEDLLAYSRVTDLLSEFRLPLGTSIELKDHGDWLKERPRLARPGTPLWTIVQTEMAPALVDQAATFVGRPVEMPVDPDSLRVLAYQAFCSGTRGFEFASESRLDAADLATRIRATTLALLNLEMELVEPWGAAGNYATMVKSNDDGVTGVVLSVDNARLVVAMRSPKNSQYVGAPEAGGTSLPTLPGIQPMHRKVPKPNDPKVPQLEDQPAMQSSGKMGQRSGNNGPDPLAIAQIDNTPSRPDGMPDNNSTQLTVPGVSEGYNVYELTPVELRPLRHRRTAGGTSIQIEDFSLVSLVLITPDPLVKTSMSQRIQAMRPKAVKLQRELSALILAQVEATSQRFIGQTQLPPVAMSISAARADLARADQMLATGDMSGAYFASRNAILPLGRWKREAWVRAVTPLTSPIASPLATCFNTLPEHLQFMAMIAKSPVGENKLAGGDAEDLPTMLQSGWKNFQRTQTDVESSVELSPMAPFNGRSSLHLQARSTKPDAAATVIESPPLEIGTASVRLGQGDIVRIRGQVRIPTAISGSVDGLMIVDSLGGEALAERIGQTNGWREFVLYRAAPQAGEVSLNFKLTGLGEAWIDDVSISFVHRGNSAAPAMNVPNATGGSGWGSVNPTAQQPSGPMFAPPPLR
jgi:hypothetical protein